MNPSLRLAGILLAILIPQLPAEEAVRHLFVAKFTLKRLEAVGLTEQQKEQFNHLSAELRREVDALREEAGINAEVITRRDEAHRELKVQKLESEEYWKQLKELAELNDAQLQGFKTTREKYDAFKQATNNLLTAEQKQMLKKNRKPKEEPTLNPTPPGE